MSQKSSEFHSNIDTFTNIFNIVLIVLGGAVISVGTYFTGSTTTRPYSYLTTLGVVLIIAGVITIAIGIWGFATHGRIVRRMKKQAKADLNY